MLLGERLAHAVLPAASILTGYVALALYGFASSIVFAGCLLLAALALAGGLARLHWPTPAEIDRRIEVASGLAHRPLATLNDRLEGDDPLAVALWRAHQRRQAAALADARVGWPAPVGVAGDPWALRGLLLLLLLVGIVTAGPAVPFRLAGAFILPSWTFPAPRLDVWITPPDYANAPPLQLAPGIPVRTLAGSHLAVLINGMRRPPAIFMAGSRFTSSELAAGSHRADAVLTRSGRLSVGPWWHRLGVWRITVTAPAAPIFRLRGAHFLPDGRLRLDWTISDPYGLEGLAVQVAPDHAPAALPQVFGLPAGTGDGGAVLDFADDPLAGLPSRLIVTARNRAGIAAVVTPGLAFTPPAPAFTDPTAAALFPQRRAIALQPDGMADVAARLGRIAAAPPSAVAASADLQLAMLASALGHGRSGRAESVRRLGLLIQQLEAGPAARATQVVAAAERALLAALKTGAAPALLQQSLRQLHQALAQKFGAAPAAGALAGQQLDLTALDRLAAKIAADQVSGHADQAAQDMAALQKMLNALQNARPMTAAEAARSAAADDAAAAIASLTAAEAKLRDDTAANAGNAARQAEIGRGLAAVNGAASQAGLALPSLGAAARAMAAAGAALGRQDQPGAEAAETTAIQALQQAGAALARARQRTLGLSGAGTDGNEGSQGNSGADDDSAGFHLPAPNPADTIQQRILREDATPSLPAPTHQYLRRLLAPSP